MGRLGGPLGWERSLERRTRKNQDRERGTEKDTQTPRTSRERKAKRARRPRDRHAERTGESERREEGLPPPPGHEGERPGSSSAGVRCSLLDSGKEAGTAPIWKQSGSLKEEGVGTKPGMSHV